MSTAEPEPLSITVCDRRVPAIAGTRPTVVEVIEELGHTVTMAEDGPLDLDAIEVLLLLGNPGYFPRMRRQLRRTPKDQRPLVVVLHSEPLPPSKASGLSRRPKLSRVEIAKIVLRNWRATDIHTNARVLRKMMDDGTIDLFFTTSAETLEYAREEGYDCTQIPYGYHPRLGRLLDRERDVDVLFLGDTRPPRRKEALASLAAAGIDVTVEGSWGADGLWGEARTEYLNRTKIIVHLQRYQGRLARKRFILAMANGVLVISEPVQNPAPFVHGEHCLFAGLEEMPALIKKYLAEPAERDRLARAGHDLVTGELAFSRSVEAMLQSVAQSSGARHNCDQST